jgi:hypothetical protein
VFCYAGDVQEDAAQLIGIPAQYLTLQYAPLTKVQGDWGSSFPTNFDGLELSERGHSRIPLPRGFRAILEEAIPALNL